MLCHVACLSIGLSNLRSTSKPLALLVGCEAELSRLLVALLEHLLWETGGMAFGFETLASRTHGCCARNMWIVTPLVPFFGISTNMNAIRDGPLYRKLT